MTDRLIEYRCKRDFSRTPEPEGAAKKSPRSPLRFVVQKHAARRLHYDFRLEMEGVLKSWAIPKGPSLDPGAKRLAVHVEDHPLDYLAFEGVIPEGQYGGGTVIVWDRGTWSSDDLDPEAAYAAGTLKFELRGERLRGHWMLVRMGGKAGEAGKNWLLIKERDETARPGSGAALTERNKRSVVSGRDIAKVAKARDRVWRSRHASRSGEAAGAGRIDPEAIAGARKATMAKSPKAQLAKLATVAPAGAEWLHEIKFDGYRMLSRIDRGKARLFSRNGKDWTDKFPAISEALAALPVRNAILDGEVVHLDGSGVSSFSALKDDLSEGRTDEALYFLFDLLHLDGFGLDGARLDARKDALARLLAKAPSERLRYSDHFDGNGARFRDEACGLALEGIVSKRRDAPYCAGRSGFWLKVKCAAREELAIIGWTDPAGSRKGLGSLLLGYYDAAGALHYAGRVGTGFSASVLIDLRRRLGRSERKTAPSPAIAAEAPRRAHWVTPELVAELRFTEWTPDGKLRHPAFLGLRDDKSAREVVTALPEAADLTAAAHGAVKSGRPSRPPTASRAAEIAGVVLTHPDKVLFPERGITKRDLAEYYAQVADRMLPHVQGRPLTLVRCPEGRRKHCFYQKHASDALPEALGRVAIPEKKGSSIYVVADDFPGLIALVQMGVLEIHVWGSTGRHIEQPDRVILDLDPDEGLAWSRVIEAAVTLRGMLDEIGLQSFAKATGGKGLHVVVPLRPRYGWDEIKAFARALAQDLVKRQPGGYTASLSKKARHDRIFIDYLRNQRGATAIAPYSVRARLGAPVAVPLSWAEVEAGVRSDQFTVETLADRLQRLRVDPWHDLMGLRQSLPASLRRRLRAA